MLRTIGSVTGIVFLMVACGGGGGGAMSALCGPYLPTVSGSVTEYSVTSGL